MVNTGGGRRKVVDLEGYGEEILRLYGEGYNYSQIAEKINVSHPEKPISRFIVSRYITEELDSIKEVNWNDKETVKRQIKQSKRNLSELSSGLDSLVEDIKHGNLSKLEIDRRTRLLNTLIGRCKAKVISQETTYNLHRQDVMDLLSEFQLKLCNTCRNKISDLLSDYEDE